MPNFMDLSLSIVTLLPSGGTQALKTYYILNFIFLTKGQVLDLKMLDRARLNGKLTRGNPLRVTHIRII